MTKKNKLNASGMALAVVGIVLSIMENPLLFFAGLGLLFYAVKVFDQAKNLDE
jgi:hypothetical protein